MKTTIIGLFLILINAQCILAQNSVAEQEIITLSKNKWQWMADKNVNALDTLFHKRAVFVHMGGVWGKEKEISVIKRGDIWYKKTNVYEVSVNIIDSTAILLNRIDLLAVVGGKEVTNPFQVIEVYIKQDSIWALVSMSFTRLITSPVIGQVPDSH